MERNQPTIDLSSQSISLAGLAFDEVLARINLNDTRDHHVAGILLLDALRRQGLSVTRPVRLLVLPVVDAPAHARRMWDDDPNEITQELPAPSFLLEGGE